jgi:hypothetical protein
MTCATGVDSPTRFGNLAGLRNELEVFLWGAPHIPQHVPCDLTQIRNKLLMRLDLATFR